MKKWYWIVLFALLGFYSLYLFSPINLVTADIGRHIVNGELMLNDFSLMSINLYSYTYPDYPIINHHWLFGIFSYFLFAAFGFSGLHLFFIFLSLLVFFIFYLITSRYSSSWIMLFIGIIVMPLIGERVEVRPEVFTYLFSGLFILLFFKFREKEISFKKLILFLLIIQILWVNSHVYFILGPAITCTFLLESVIKKDKEKIKQLGIIFAFLFLVSLINPFGIQGALEPFTIFENYEYNLVENKSVLYLENLIYKSNFLIFKIVFGVLALSFIGVFLKNKKIDWAMLFLSMGFSLMGWLMLRNFTIFGLFSFVAISSNLQKIFSDKKLKEIYIYIFAIILGILLLISLVAINKDLSIQNFGIGTLENNLECINFLKENHISGKIFNNYDIGGYLIFGLYPEEKVFVDNRPEEYPPGFFNKIYIPMQEDDEVWKQESEKYDFNAIVFSRLDMTEWGQGFLIKRVFDEDWAVVFVDNWTIVILKRNEKNKEVIEKFEIAKDNFGVK